MILVMLGTNPYPFTRLVNEVSKWASNTGAHIIVQSGNTPINDGELEVYQFIDHSKLMDLMLQAELVITQGGFGTLQDCMRLGVKTIAVPRYVEHGESMDDQKEIVDALAKEDLIVPLYDVTKIDSAIRQALSKEIKANDSYQLPRHVATTIKKLLGK